MALKLRTRLNSSNTHVPELDDQVGFDMGLASFFSVVDWFPLEVVDADLDPGGLLY
jgi:hypothetical protein